MFCNVVTTLIYSKERIISNAFDASMICKDEGSELGFSKRKKKCPGHIRAEETC